MNLNLEIFFIVINWPKFRGIYPDTNEVAPTQYSLVETSKVMPAKTLIKIAKVLEVPLDALVNDRAAPAHEVTIKDNTLIDKVRLIDDLPEQEKKYDFTGY